MIGCLVCRMDFSLLYLNGNGNRFITINFEIHEVFETSAPMMRVCSAGFRPIIKLLNIMFCLCWAIRFPFRCPQNKNGKLFISITANGYAESSVCMFVSVFFPFEFSFLFCSFWKKVANSPFPFRNFCFN